MPNWQVKCIPSQAAINEGSALLANTLSAIALFQTSADGRIELVPPVT